MKRRHDYDSMSEAAQKRPAGGSKRWRYKGKRCLLFCLHQAIQRCRVLRNRARLLVSHSHHTLFICKAFSVHITFCSLFSSDFPP